MVLWHLVVVMLGIMAVIAGFSKIAYHLVVDFGVLHRICDFFDNKAGRAVASGVSDAYTDVDSTGVCIRGVVFGAVVVLIGLFGLAFSSLL